MHSFELENNYYENWRNYPIQWYCTCMFFFGFEGQTWMEYLFYCSKSMWILLLFISLSLSVALCSTCICVLFIERPWLFDNFDSWLKRIQGKPHKCAAIFVDNSGADIILGIFPFARDLLSRGTKVIRNITFFYWNL